MGERRHWLSSYYPVRTPDGEVIGVGAVIMEITDRKRADDRLRLLAEAGELFSSSLDQEEIASRIAQVAGAQARRHLQRLSRRRGTTLRRVACVSADPEVHPVLESLPTSFAVGEPEQGRLAGVYRSAEPLLLQTVPAEYLDELSPFRRRSRGFQPDRHPLAHAPADRRSRPDAGSDHARLASPGSVRRARCRPRSGARGPGGRRDGQRPAGRRASAPRAGCAGARVRRRRRVPDRARRAGSALESRRRARHRTLGRPASSDARRAAAGRRPLERRAIASRRFPFDGPRGELWLSITAAGFPHGTVYAFRDLTDERAVEQLKSDFVSTVSHELRTPLAAIYGAAMTLRRDDVVLGHAQETGMLEVISRRVGTARPDRQRHPACQPARFRGGAAS